MYFNLNIYVYPKNIFMFTIDSRFVLTDNVYKILNNITSKVMNGSGTVNCCLREPVVGANRWSKTVPVAHELPG